MKAIFKAVDRLTRPVRGMSRGVHGFGMSAEKSLRKVDRAMMGVHASLAKVARGAGVAALALGLVGGSVIGTGADFEQAITNVGAVGLKTRSEIAALEEKALQLGATTQFTATQSANAMEIMAKAGFEQEQILGSVGSVLSAAAASGLEIAEVSDHVSNAMKGMGLEVIDAQTGMNNAARVADVLALASSRTNSSIGSLGESLKNVAGTASDLGISVEDTVGAVALLQDVGLDASVAGSALNTMLTQIAAGTGAVSKRAKDANGNLRSFPELLAIISDEAAKSGGSMDRVAYLADLVGLRGQKAASKLAALFDSGKVQALSKELDGASGAAEEMAKIRMDTLHGDWTLLGSAVDGVKVALFDTQGGPLRGLVQGMTSWVEKNKELITSGVGGFLTSIGDNMGEIAKWAKRIGILVGIFYGIAAAIKIATAATTLFNLVMAANPITLIALGIVAAIALIIAFWPEVTAFLGNVWSAIKEGGEALFAWFRALVQRIIDAGGLFHILWEGIKAGWSALVDFILGGGVVGIIIRNWGSIGPALAELWESIKTAAGAAFDWIAEKVRGVIGWALEGLAKIGKAVGSAIDGVGDFLFGDGDGEGADGRDPPGAGQDGEAGQRGRRRPDRPGAPKPPQVQGPALSRSESVTRSEASVTIQDQTGRATVSGTTSAPGFQLHLQKSGAT